VIRGEVRLGRPLVAGFLVLPRLLLGDRLTFLVDTGADASAIYPRDAQRLGLSHDLVFDDSDIVVSVGVGGRVEEYIEAGIVMLQHDDGSVDRLLVPMHFAKPSPANAEYPSLLGRDVLSFYRLVFEERVGLVTLENPASATSPAAQQE
jgi:hypothetical protein